MLHSAYGYKGGFSAPHRAAALAGHDILAAGGSAVEAMVAAAAVANVAYPHMNGIGGDGVWIVSRPGQPVVTVAGIGRAAARATPDWYAARGHGAAIPPRGPLSALTVPGTVAGWHAALKHCPQGNRLPLSELLAPAIALAREGVAVTANQARLTGEKLDAIGNVPGFAETYLHEGKPPAAGHRLVQTALAGTFEHLAREGLSEYYRGEVARANAAFLESVGSPLGLADFTGFAVAAGPALTTTLRVGQIWNNPPPTQGVASLMILALFDRLQVDRGEGFAHLHGLIEATKLAFRRRNAELADPDYMASRPEDWLQPAALDALVTQIDPARARPWPEAPRPGGTIWMGAADSSGCVVSFNQSIFMEFGSGLCCPQTGVLFHNRGIGFSLMPGPNQLRPHARPFHTLNPALARLNAGRILAYGTMGGDGQPQTQAAIFTRYAQFGFGLQAAVTAPRWILGDTWGDATTSLKLEDRFPTDLVAQLRNAGHDLELIAPYSETAGHAGGVAFSPGGLIEVASDPRADGAALAF